MPGTPEWTQMWLKAIRKNAPDFQPQAAAKPAPPQAGSTAAPAAGSPTDPATPQPFMTGQNMIDKGNAQLQYEQGMQGIDDGLENQRINNEYTKGQIDKGAIADRDAAQWNMGGRGLGQSSVRDGALYDIDATAAIKKNFLDTQLATATTNAGTAKTHLGDWWNTFQGGMNQQMVENVPQRQDAGPQPGQPTAPGAPAAPAAPAAPQPTKASHVAVFRQMGIPGNTPVGHSERGPYFEQPAAGGGTWHIYGPNPKDRVLVKPGRHS